MHPLFLSINGESCGPYTLAELKLLRRHGAVTAQTPHLNKDGDQWVPLSENKEIYAAIEEKLLGEGALILERMQKIKLLISDPDKLKELDPLVLDKEIKAITDALPRLLATPEYVSVEELAAWFKPVYQETKELNSGLQKEASRLIDDHKNLLEHLSSTDTLNANLSAQIKTESEARSQWLQDTLLELDSRRLDGLRKVLEGLDTRLSGFEQRRVEAETEAQKSRHNLLASMTTAEGLQVKLAEGLKEDVQVRIDWLTGAIKQLEESRQISTEQWRSSVADLMDARFILQTERATKLGEELSSIKLELEQTLPDKLLILKSDLVTKTELLEAGQKSLAESFLLNQSQTDSAREQSTLKQQTQIEALEKQVTESKAALSEELKTQIEELKSNLTKADLESHDRATRINKVLKERFVIDDQHYKEQETRELKIEEIQTTYFQFIGEYFEWLKSEVIAATDSRLQTAETLAKQTDWHSSAQTKVEELLAKSSHEAQTAHASLLATLTQSLLSTQQKIDQTFEQGFKDNQSKRALAFADLKTLQIESRRADQDSLRSQLAQLSSETQDFKKQLSEQSEHESQEILQQHSHSLKTLQSDLTTQSQADQSALLQRLDLGEKNLTQFKEEILNTLERTQTFGLQQVEKLITQSQETLSTQSKQGHALILQAIQKQKEELTSIVSSVQSLQESHVEIKDTLSETKKSLQILTQLINDSTEQIRKGQSVLQDASTLLVGRLDRWMDDEPNRLAAAQGFLQLGLQEVRMGVQAGFARQTPEQWSASLSELGNKIQLIQTQMDTMQHDIPLKLQSSLGIQEKKLIADNEAQFKDSSAVIRRSMEGVFSMLDNISKQVLDAGERLIVLQKVTQRVDGMERQTTEMLDHTEQQRQEARMDSVKSALIVSSKVRQAKAARRSRG